MANQGHVASGRSISESKLGKEGRSGDTNLRVISKQEKNEKVQEKYVERREQLFWPPKCKCFKSLEVVHT